MFEVCFKYVQDVVSTYKVCIGYTEYVQSMKKISYHSVLSPTTACIDSNCVRGRRGSIAISISGCLVVRRCQFRYRYFSFLQHSVLSPTTAFIASNCARGRRGNIVISISGCLVVRCCQFRYFSVLRLKVWIDNLNNRRDFLCVPVNLRRRCPL